MMYPRLRLARNLLADDGVIFISIDDNEVNNLIKICNEIFGTDKFLACFPRITKKAGKTTDIIAKNHDYIVAYSKTDNPSFYLPLHTDSGFKFSDEYEADRGKYKLNQTLDYDSLQYSSSLDYPITIGHLTINISNENKVTMLVLIGHGVGVKIFLNLDIKMDLSL